MRVVTSCEGNEGRVSYDCHTRRYWTGSSPSTAANQSAHRRSWNISPRERNRSVTRGMSSRTLQAVTPCLSGN